MASNYIRKEKKGKKKDKKFEPQGETEKSNIRIEDFNTSFSVTDNNSLKELLHI